MGFEGLGPDHHHDGGLVGRRCSLWPPAIDLGRAGWIGNTFLSAPQSSPHEYSARRARNPAPAGERRDVTGVAHLARVGKSLALQVRRGRYRS